MSKQNRYWFEKTDDSEERWDEIKRLWEQHTWLYAVLGFLLGVAIVPFANLEIHEFIGNLFPELVGIAVTVLIIDRFNRNMATRQLKQQLVRQMRTKDNAFAIHSLEELRAINGHKDGSLLKANLTKTHLQEARMGFSNLEEVNFTDAKLSQVSFVCCNLKGAILINADCTKADFSDADLSDANLWNANLGNARFNRAKLRGAFLQDVNLKGAWQITDEQLVYADSLLSTIMPDGSTYNGRYNLSGDKKYAMFMDGFDFDASTPEEMADWYTVSLEEYLQGQRWAEENLSRIKTKE